MASRQQQSKRDRGRAHVGLPAKQPQYGTCPQCGDPIHNRGAHAEACRGNRVFTGEFQCPCCLAMSRQGGLCFCGGRRFPVFSAAGRRAAG